MTRKPGIPAIDADTKRLEKLQARSKKAKGIVGKFFQLPHADGYAFYSVVAAEGQRVQIQHEALLDAWQDCILGAGGWFPREQIEPIIKRQEQAQKTFSALAEKQQSEKAKYGMVVGAAAVADLGQNADVYDLASWAWKRGHRNGHKDVRILKDGRMPWANDIAAALIDSGCFPAIEHLKDPVVFIMLTDKFSDPIAHRNPPPAKEEVLAKVKEAFIAAIGVAPEGLKIERTESKYLDNNSLTVLNGQGVKVGSVCYNAADGAILQVNVAFYVDEKGVRSE